MFLSLFCFTVGGVFLYVSWWVGWIAGNTSETWIWIISTTFVIFGLATFAAIVVSRGKRHGRVTRLYPWASVLMVIPIAALFGINGYRTAELGLTLLFVIVLYLNGRAMLELHRG